MIDFKQAEKEIAENREEVIQKLVDFSFTDTLLFWSKDTKIKKIQEEKWAPVLFWFSKKFNINLEKTDSFDVPKGNQRYRNEMEAVMDKLPIKQLTAFYFISVRLKSTLLALAMVEGQISAEEAVELSYLEEIHQNEIWRTERKSFYARKQIKKEIEEIEEYLKK